jgi:hypothetical protein
LHANQCFSPVADMRNGEDIYPARLQHAIVNRTITPSLPVAKNLSR